MNLFFDFSAPAGADPCRRALEQAQRLLGCFHKAVVNELPNKLVAIQGLARLLTEDEGRRLSEEARGHLARLAALTQSADGVVRALAAVERLSGGPAPAERISLAEVVREAAVEVKLLSNVRGVEYHFQEVMPVVTLPRQAMYQVLVQLLRNAVEAAVAGRSLRVEVGAAVRGDGAEVWVADNGRGMPEGLQHDLFAPFAGGTTISGRIGLGLFLVRQVVAGWGGAIRVQSEERLGTRIALFIPSVAVVTPSARVAAAAAGEPAPSGLPQQN